MCYSMIIKFKSSNFSQFISILGKYSCNETNKQQLIILLIGILSIGLITTGLTNNVPYKREQCRPIFDYSSFFNQAAICESENDTALSCNNVFLEFNGIVGNNPRRTSVKRIIHCLYFYFLVHF